MKSVAAVNLVGLFLVFASLSPAILAQSVDNEQQNLHYDLSGDPLPQHAVVRLGTTRLLQQRLESVGFSPDGTQLVSAGWDSIIRIWDVKSGREVQRFDTPHEDTLVAVFSPNGNSVATGSTNGSVRLWDVRTGKLRWEALAHKENVGGARVYSIAFSPDGASFASAGADNRVIIWHTALGTKHLELNDDGGRDAHPVAFSSDGTLVASGSLAADATIRIWNINHPAVPQFLDHAHPDDITSLAFTPDGKQLISGGARFQRFENGELRTVSEIRVWDLAEGKQLGEFTTDEPLLGECSLALSADGQVLCSCHYDKVVVWDVHSRTARRIIEVDSKQMGGRSHGIAVSPQGEFVASKANDNQVRVWSTQTGEHVFQQPPTHRAAVTAVQFSADGSTVITGSADATVRLWNAQTGEHSRIIAQSSGWVRFLGYLPDGEHVAIGAEYIAADPPNVRGELKICRASDAHVLHHFQVDSRLVIGAISPDGKRIAAATGLGIAIDQEAKVGMHVWDLESGQKIIQWEPRQSRVVQMAFTSPGNEIWSLSESGWLDRWDFATSNQLQQVDLKGDQEGVFRGAFMNTDIHSVCTGRLLRYERRYGTLDLRDSTSGESLWSVELPGRWPYSIAVSNNGKLIAAYLRAISNSGAEDAIGVFSAEDGKQIHSFTFDNEEVSSLAFTPDNRRLASGMTRGSTLIWELSELHDE